METAGTNGWTTADPMLYRTADPMLYRTADPMLYRTAVRYNRPVGPHGRAGLRFDPIIHPHDQLFQNNSINLNSSQVFHYMARRFRDTKPRLQGWDYSGPGQYFITMVTQGRECIFGRVEDHTMVLSDLGEIVREEWLKSFGMRPELHCDAWVIMPNHLHAILCIEKSVSENGLINKPLQNPGIAYRPPRSIPSFVAGFKSAATKRINAHRGTPGEKIWQDRYHDHIIRDHAAFMNIKQYIENNPARWDNDIFSPM